MIIKSDNCAPAGLLWGISLGNVIAYFLPLIREC